MSHQCKACGHIPICPNCGYNENEEPTEEQIEEMRKAGAWEGAFIKHQTTEYYREVWAKKKGYEFKPKPFKEEDYQ